MQYLIYDIILLLANIHGCVCVFEPLPNGHVTNLRVCEVINCERKGEDLRFSSVIILLDNFTSNKLYEIIRKRRNKETQNPGVVEH